MYKGKRVAFVFSVLAVTVLLALSLGGCGSGGLSGTLKLSGSTTVLPLAQEAADQLMDENKDLKITVQGGGSSVGITQVSEGVVEIGNSSRDLKPEEQSLGLVDNKIALDIIVAIVNPDSVKVDNLSMDQLKGIFLGTYTDWSQVGGEAGPIKVIIRDEASGTREMFDEKVLGSKKDAPVKPVSGAEEANSSGVLRQKVASMKGAIGYISKGYVDNSVKELKLDGAEPTTENAVSKKYALSRYLHMFTKGEPTGLAASYIDYVLSDDFQQNVVAKEYIPIEEAEGKTSK